MIIKLIKQQADLHVAHKSEAVAMQLQLQLMHQQISVLETKLRSFKLGQDAAQTTDRIKISTKQGFEWIASNQIIYCEAQGNYCIIYMQEKNCENTTTAYVVSKSLKTFSEQLPPSDFIRCHQSYLINKNHVLRFVSKGGLYLTMRNQQNVSVSRRRKQLVCEILLNN